MKRLLLLTLTVLCAGTIALAQKKAGIPNPAIDMPGYLRVASEAAEYRESRRLTEEEFIKMSKEPGTIILDARSTEKYNELHIKGAVNLSFPDITVESLNATFPDKNTRILIYCNNNFVGAEKPFPTKMAVASLNLSTYISLYSYGYKNVYELGPLLDIKTSKLDFVSASGKKSACGLTPWQASVGCAMPDTRALKHRLKFVRLHNLGSAKLNFDPLLTSDSTATEPPCCSTTSLTNASPRPVDSSSFS